MKRIGHKEGAAFLYKWLTKNRPDRSFISFLADIEEFHSHAAKYRGVLSDISYEITFANDDDYLLFLLSL